MSVPFQSQWIDVLLNVLFAAEDRRLDKRIFELTERNSQLKKETCYGFMYQGERYVPKAYLGHLKAVRRISSLHFELNNELLSFIMDSNKVKQDKVHIKQLLTLLLSQCKDVQEARDSIPDCLANLTELRTTPRKCQDPTFLIRNNKHFLAEYERTLPKIQFYTATQLLY